MWVAVEFPARISKVNAEFPVLLHFRTPLLLLMTHHEKTWLNESFTVVLTLTLGGGGGYERVQQHQISSPGLASLVKACFLQNFYAKGKAANKFSSIVRYW